MKKLFALILAAMLLLSACTPAAQQSGETIAQGDAGVIDFVTSQFKHITNGGITEITDGLNGGERLVVSGQTYLDDGTVVRVVSGADAAADTTPESTAPAEGANS